MPLQYSTNLLVIYTPTRPRRAQHAEMVRQALTLSLIALHCAIGAGYKTGKVVSCNA